MGAAANLPLTSQPIKILQCPSAANADRKDGDPQTANWNIVAVTDYAASTGVSPFATNVNNTGGYEAGILEKNRIPGNRLADVTDGLSNTFAVVESAGRPQIYRNGQTYGTVPAQKVNGGGWARPASDLDYYTSTPDGPAPRGRARSAAPTASTTRRTTWRRSAPRVPVLRIRSTRPASTLSTATAR